MWSTPVDKNSTQCRPKQLQVHYAFVCRVADAGELNAADRRRVQNTRPWQTAV